MAVIAKSIWKPNKTNIHLVEGEAYDGTAQGRKTYTIRRYNDDSK